MSSLTQIDGAAIARHTRNAPIEMIDKDDSSLPKCFSRQPPSTRTMTNSELHSRLGEILTSCIRALPVKKTVDEYTQTMWRRNSDEHHKDWKNQNLDWLFPDGQPLPIEFRGNLHQSHTEDINKRVWDRESIIDFLKMLFRRFQHIAKGIEVVQAMNERDKSNITKDFDKTEKSKNFFNHTAIESRQVLCEIHSLILDLNYRPDMNPKIPPETADDKKIKDMLKHWVIYREYETLLDYASKLLNIIRNNPDFAKSAKAY